MRKFVGIWLLVLLVLPAGCAKKNAGIVNTVDTGYKVYYELEDGTWQSDGKLYKYRLEISGRMPNAEADTTFVYLSNRKNISFEQAWKAAGFSSSMTDYFAADDAVLVDLKIG